MVASFNEPTCGGDDITVQYLLPQSPSLTVVVAYCHEPTCGGDDITVSVAPAPSLNPKYEGHSSDCLPS